MKEWGLIDNFWQYRKLPDRVLMLWREVARAEAAGMNKDERKPTQDLLAREMEEDG